ncbi:uncharacterized protein LOC111322446 [Stylophora pistillata]|uniref:uncharacterized protein LOC111322446 n=1 Tax=Stylophora pistillata TaxID=50429 RepID=UPI000C040799|nr:uncharacterized protein LOC111322446 [Stylophora pistillata]
MIDRVTGSTSFRNRLLSDDMHRLSLEQNFSFFYSPVDNTSFSAAVAIPEYGLKYLQAKDMDLKGVSNLSDSKGEDVIVAPWDICPTTPVAAKDSMPVYKLSTANAKDIIDDQNRTNNCHKKKLQNLLFDAYVTKKTASDNWDV